MVAADTDLSPDESYTSGSMSIQQSGAALRQAAAEARLVLLELAAARLGVAVAALSVDDGRIVASGASASTSYWELVSDTTLRIEATGRATPKVAADRRLVGRPVPRLDIPGKVFGEAVFIHDLQLPGMLHARVVRPPSYGARLVSIDDAPARALPGVVSVVRDGSFLAVVAEREEQAIAAAETLAGAARWEGASPLPTGDSIAEWLRGMPSREGTVSSKGADPAAAAGAGAAAKTIEAEYAKPFIAHASLGPSCAVAQVTGDRLRVWTHGQGVFPMRAALAKLLGIAPDHLRVTHLDGAGCYGHNGADDAACDAALIARALPPAVRCACSGRAATSRPGRRSVPPWRSARAAVSTRRATSLRGRTSSGAMPTRRGPDGARPGSSPPGTWRRRRRPRRRSTSRSRRAARPQRGAALRLREPARGRALRAGHAGASVGAAVPGCVRQRVRDRVVHGRAGGRRERRPGRVPVAPSLGCARESVIEARGGVRAARPAAATGTRRPRRRKRAGGANGNTVRGAGFAFARYKNQAAYVALVAEVAVDRAEGRIRVERMTAAVDAGDVVNPDGLRNQIEGGIDAGRVVDALRGSGVRSRADHQRRLAQLPDRALHRGAPRERGGRRAS